MLAFVSPSDFVSKPYQIPGLSDPDLGTGAFSDFVAKEQRDLLLSLLGETFYGAFEDGLEELPGEWIAATQYAINATVSYGTHTFESLVGNNQNIIPTSDPLSWQDLGEDRWLLLEKGGDYTNTLDNRKYKWEGMNAVLKPFMYVAWLIEQDTQVATTGGTTKTSLENSSNADSAIKISQAFTDYTELAGDSCTITNQGSLYWFLYSSTLYFDDVDAEGDQDFISYLNAHWSLELGSMNEFDI